jgi:uridine kinase
VGETSCIEVEGQMVNNFVDRLAEVKTCSLTQDNVFSLVVLDGLYKYTDSLLHNRMDSIKLFVKVRSLL